MKSFFQSREAQARLIIAAGKWEGTPFHPHAAVKGVGVDCVWLAAELYIECGVLTRFDPPKYTMDGGQHNGLSQVCDFLDRSPAFCLAWTAFNNCPPELEPGDLLCFRMGRVIHHVGVMVTDREFIHVYQGHMVTFSRVDDTTWNKRLAAIYQPVATARSQVGNPQPIPID